MRFSQEVGRAFFTRGRPCVRGLTCPFCNALWRVSVSFDCLACSFWASRLNYQTLSAEKVLKADLTITRQNILQCINSSGNSRTWALQRYLCKIDDEMVQPPAFARSPKPDNRAFESSRRDLHNALLCTAFGILCTALRSQWVLVQVFLTKNVPLCFAKFYKNLDGIFP